MKRSTRETVRLETLEGRTLMAANPLALAITSSVVVNQTSVRVLGTTGNDAIKVAPTSTGLLISNGTWSATVAGSSFASITIDAGAGNDSIIIDPKITISTLLYGGAGNDSISGGAGADRIYDNLGINKVLGGAGDDTIVTIGQTSGTIAGNDGNDSFWTGAATTGTVLDASAVELKQTIHRVTGFYGATTAAAKTVSASATVKVSLADPTMTDARMVYRNFSDKPLFASSGPVADDIVQGYLGDCYFLATLSSLAKVSANTIKQSVVELGDGTYAVQFLRNGVASFVRVDGDLPAWNWGPLAYANFGKQNSVWVGVMEKAYAYFRTGKGTYASLNGGWMQNVYTDLGINSISAYTSTSATSLINTIKSQLDAGMSVTYAAGSVPSGAPLIGSHAYMVDHVNYDANGAAISITLRNPWGVDGAGSDGANDGYVTITAAQAQAAFLGMTAAKVA